VTGYWFNEQQATRNKQQKMPYYPIFLDLKDQNVLVVGGGKVAERKILNLLRYGCRIHVVSPGLTSQLEKLVSEKKIQHIPEQLLNQAMSKAFMVIAATDDPAVNGKIASRAKEHGLLVNAVDQPRDCNFIMPSIVRSGDLQIAISTGGKSPALAKRIRKELQALFGSEYGSFVELLGMLREELLARIGTSSKNKPLFENLVNSDLLELIRKGDIDGIQATLRSTLGAGFPVDDIVMRVFKKPTRRTVDKGKGSRQKQR
jgi:precorrin-2 dehydrogenase/sirohydrochlorin ferrochelatase